MHKREPSRSTGQKITPAIRHIICPDEFDFTAPSLFFAGGISNCPDWQSDLAAILADQNLTAFNPRRPNFPIHDPSASDDQIKWEHRYLRQATAVSFWFPKETVCPITLYELGTYTLSDAPIFVGMHPEYERATELLALTAVHRPKLQIALSLIELADQIKSWIKDPLVHGADAPLLPPVPNNTIFIAGGIKDCPDWQTNFSNTIEEMGLNVYNPRRAEFIVASESAYAAEVRTNHERLMKSEAISFWFPKESINPMVLYELGVASMTGKPLFIGVDPDYARRQDVEIQTSLVRPDIEISYSLEDLAAQIKDWKKKAA